MGKCMQETNRALLHELLDMAVDINGLESRQSSLTGDLPTASVAFDFVGHIGMIVLNIRWNGYGNPDHKFDCSAYTGLVDDDCSGLLYGDFLPDVVSKLRQDMISHGFAGDSNSGK